MLLLQHYIKKVWFSLITNTNVLLHLIAICLSCSICLRYRGCSSRAPLHQLQWRGLPSPAPVQLCLHVEMQLQTTTYSHRQSTNPNKLQAQRQNTNLYHLMPTHYQLPSAPTKSTDTINCSCSWRHAPIAGEEGSPSPLQSIAEGRARGRRDIWAQGTED